MADWDWGRIAVEAAGLIGSGIAGAITGAWRWGRKGAQHDQKVKDDYEAKIEAEGRELRDMITESSGQFDETLKGLRQKINDVELDTERRFLQKDEFEDFRKEYRQDQRRTDDKLDRLLGMRQ